MGELKLQSQEEFEKCKKKIKGHFKEAIKSLKMAQKECQKLVSAKWQHLIGKEIKEEIYRIQEIEVNYLEPLNRKYLIQRELNVKIKNVAQSLE